MNHRLKIVQTYRVEPTTYADVPGAYIPDATHGDDRHINSHFAGGGGDVWCG